MKIKRALALACASSVLPFAAAACGSSYDRTEFIDELVADAGVTEEQAICITDRVEAEIGVDRLNSRGDLTDEETEALTDAIFDCAFGTDE